MTHAIFTRLSSCHAWPPVAIRSTPRLNYSAFYRSAETIYPEYFNLKTRKIFIHSKYRIFSSYLILLATLLLPGAAAQSQPNILFIFTDDQGPWTPGYTGNRQNHTPHLNRLANEGVRFDNAFVTTPVCSPRARR